METSSGAKKLGMYAVCAFLACFEKESPGEAMGDML